METKQELRAYFFQNFYLQGIHAGIQSQHTTTEMFVKYKGIYVDQEHSGCKAQEILYDWAENYKTTVILNGGMQKDLEEILKVLETVEHNYPFSFFREGDNALNGALTNVGVILPERIFNYNKRVVEVVELNHLEGAYYRPPELSKSDKTIAELLSRKRLMS